MQNRLKRIGLYHFGFSLFEVNIVLAILTLLIVVSFGVDSNLFEHYSFRDERDKVVSILLQARANAVSGLCVRSGCIDASPYGVAIIGKQIILFEGETYSEGDSYNEVYAVNSLEFSGITEVHFRRLSGETEVSPSSSSNLTIADSFGNKSVVTVGSFGGISWTN